MLDKALMNKIDCLSNALYHRWKKTLCDKIKNQFGKIPFFFDKKKWTFCQNIKSSYSNSFNRIQPNQIYFYQFFFLFMKKKTLKFYAKNSKKEERTIKSKKK